MAKKKPQTSKGRGRPPKPNRSPAFVVYARVDPAFETALDRYIEATRPRPSLTAIVEAALEDFLKKAGFWPPPAPSPESSSE